MGIDNWKRLLLMKEDNSTQIEQLQWQLNQQRMLTAQVIQLVDLKTKFSVDSDERLKKKSKCSPEIYEDTEKVSDFVVNNHNMGVDEPIGVPEESEFVELLEREFGPQKPPETSGEDSTVLSQEDLRRFIRDLQLELAEGRLEKIERPSPTYKYSKEKISFATVGAGVVALFMGWIGWLSLKVIGQGETLAAIVATVETLKK
jgi:hypothetical protein